MDLEELEQGLSKEGRLFLKRLFPVNRQTCTIEDFCSVHRVTRETFRVRAKSGQAPARTRIEGVRWPVLTRAEVVRWLARLERDREQTRKPWLRWSLAPFEGLMLEASEQALLSGIPEHLHNEALELRRRLEPELGEHLDANEINDIVRTKMVRQRERE